MKNAFHWTMNPEPRPLSLFLFVFRVGADHAHDPLAANDLAVLTDTSDAGSDFHCSGTFRDLGHRLPTGESGLISEEFPELNLAGTLV